MQRVALYVSKHPPSAVDCERLVIERLLCYASGEAVSPNVENQKELVLWVFSIQHYHSVDILCQWELNKVVDVKFLVDEQLYIFL